MCGIAGFTSNWGEAAATRVLTAMTDALAHRGPDGEGLHLAHGAAGEIVALGHRRLSIIDLATGDQPLHLDDGRFSIVFNGEIYNYVELRETLVAEGCRFSTTSDTEVLLRAWAQWGRDALPRLRGMFAFAIWDDRAQELVLARDPFGKKPLYYIEKDGRLTFASEFAALVRHPDFSGEIDRNALAQFLIWKYVPGPGTLLGGVREVPPGHFAVRRAGRELEISRYYTVPLPEADPARRLPDAPATVEGFRAALAEAVALRLRSDVPLGAFLSGGVDSSAIVALMAQMTDTPVRTFSVGFHEETYSELWAARLVAERFGTEHHEIKIAPADFLDRLEEVTWQRGAPLSEMADVPLYALSHLAAGHVKVVLSGEGADELLGGYPKHRADTLLERAQGLVPPALDGLVGAVGQALPYRFRRAAILARVAQERDFTGRQAAWFGLMGQEEAARLCPGLFADYRPFLWEDDCGPDFGALARSLRFDKTVWLPGTLLERGDRMTMAASIEARMPFMDSELCAFVARLPRQAFVAGGRGKAILRRAMAKDLPREILEKPKVGFRVPIHEWLRGPLRDFAEDRLLGPGSRLADYADTARLRAMWDEHQAMRRNREKELWSLLSLEIFLRQVTNLPAARLAG